MIIKRIRATNFRNCVDAQLELATVNIVTGPNGAGKSTFAAAIEYALTGRCGWTDRAGRGSDGLLRADPGVISGAAEIETDIGRITRSVPSGSLQIEGKMGSPKVLQDLIYEALGANADMISAALNAYQFADLPPKEQSDMLFALAGLQFDGPGIRAELGKRAGCSEAAMEVFNALCPARLAGGAEVFDVLDKLTRDARRDTNRDLKSAQSALKLLPSPPQLPAGVTAEDAQKAKATLPELAAEERDLLASRGAAEERARQVKAADGGIIRIDGIISGRVVALHDLGAQADMDLKAAAAARAAAYAENGKRRADYERLQHEFNVEDSALAEARKTVEQLAAAIGAPCPLAPEHLMCRAAPEEITALTAAMEADIARRSAENEERKQGVETAWEVYMKAARAVELARAIESHIELLAEDQANRAKLVAELKTLKAKPAAAALDTDLDALRKAQATALKTVDALAAVERDAAGRKQLQHKIDLLAMQSQALDWLVEALGPTGLKAEKLGALLGELQDRADDRLKQLTGDGLGFLFEMEEGQLRLLVDTGGARLPLSHLSQSERLRAGIALQDVLNSLTGLRIMVIDDCDVLDEVSRGHLIGTIQAIEDQYDTIIVIAARSTPTTAPQLEGWRAFWVEDGAARVVE